MDNEKDLQFPLLNESLGLRLHDKTFIPLFGIKKARPVEEVGVAGVVVRGHPAVSDTHAANVDPVLKPTLYSSYHYPTLFSFLLNFSSSGFVLLMNSPGDGWNKLSSVGFSKGIERIGLET